MADQPDSKRRLTSGAAAIGVAFLVLIVWWVASGNSPFAPRGNGELLQPPDIEATGEPGSTSSTPQLSNPRGLRIDSYVIESSDETGSRIWLNYTTGAVECVGELDTPRVLENDGSVTVTLSTVPPEDPPAACDSMARLKSVRVVTDTPLAGRAVLDGSFSPAVRVEPTDEAYESTTP